MNMIRVIRLSVLVIGIIISAACLLPFIILALINTGYDYLAKGIQGVIKSIRQYLSRKTYTYWMCKYGSRFHIIPCFSIAIEDLGFQDDYSALCIEIGWLNRWCAIEIVLKRRGVHHG